MVRSETLLSNLIDTSLFFRGKSIFCSVSKSTAYTGEHSTCRGTTVEPMKNLKVAVRISSNELGSMVNVTSSPLFPDVADGCAQSYVPANLQSFELVTVTATSPPKPFIFISFVDNESESFISFTGSSLSEQPHRKRVADNTIDILFNRFILCILFKR